MPEPRFGRRYRVKTAAIATAVVVAIWATLFAPAAPTRAADDKLLQRVKGTVQFQNPNAPATTIVGKQLIGDDAAAITQAKSAATLTLPDSSIVALGENTNISVGAFNQVSQTGPGSLTVKVTTGTLRFDVHRVNGAAADYHFSTPTTQIAVRGTIGLLSLAANGTTTVACVVCAADSVSVSVVGSTQTITLISGQLLTVSAAGAVVTGAVTSATLGSFSAAGVSTSAASGAAAATAGVASGAAAGAAVGTTAAVAAGAVGAAAAVSSSTTSNANATPLPGVGGNNNSNTTPAPTGTGSGTINLTGFRPTPSPSPFARPTTPPQAPALGPPGRH